MVLLFAASCSKSEPSAPPSPPPTATRVAPVDDIPTLSAEMDRLEDAKDDRGAAAVGDKLIAALRAKKLTTDATWPETLETYARVLFSSGRWQEVEAPLREALATPRGKSDLGLRASLLFQLGTLLSEERRNEDAIPVLTESLELSEKVHGPDSYATSNSVEVLASVYDYVGRYTEAEPLFRRSLALAAKEHGASSEQVGRVTMNLALNLAFQERNDEAFVMYKRAIPMLEETKGYARAALAEAHAGIGEIQRRRGKLELALASYRRGLAVRIEALGADHPLTAMDNYNISIVLEEQRKYPEAIAACEKSEALRAKVLAPEHPYRVQTEAACARMRDAAARPLSKVRKKRT
jgi:tetratricopeptide (TPR) repeat protein